MDQPYISPFISAAEHLFDTLFQLDVEVGFPIHGANHAAGDDISGAITLSGDLHGVVVLGFPRSTAQRVVSLFTGVEPADESREILADAVGELASMIAGHAKVRFHGARIDVSCPVVTRRGERTIQQQAAATSITLPCHCDCGEFCIEISLENLADAPFEAVPAGHHAH